MKDLPTIPPEQLRAIEERCSKATAEPWEVRQGGYNNCGPRRVMYYDPQWGEWREVPDVEFDMQFIAHARTDLPALVQEVKRLTEKLGAAEQVVLDWFFVMEDKAREDCGTNLWTRRLEAARNVIAAGHKAGRLSDSSSKSQPSRKGPGFVADETVSESTEDSKQIGRAMRAPDPDIEAIGIVAQLRADNARLREAQLKRDVALNSLFGYASSIQFAEVVEDKGMKFIRMPASWADGLTEYVKEARAALATEKATESDPKTLPSPPEHSA